VHHGEEPGTQRRFAARASAISLLVLERLDAWISRSHDPKGSCVHYSVMFQPCETISKVRQRTHTVMRRSVREVAAAGAFIILTSCGSTTVTPTPHLVTIQSAVTCPAPPVHTAVAHPVRHYPAAPNATPNTHVGYCAYIATTHGVVSVRLRPQYAPRAVNDFLFLAQRGFYDGLAFDQICPAASGIPCPGQVPLAVAGDPTGAGTGGPGYSLKADPIVGKYLFGSVAMFTSGSNTLGSQFFVSTGDTHTLPATYDIFGQVTGGIQALVELQKGDKIVWIAIVLTPPEP
jgi:cyclophilin family peptidyl-prolyl cis-trans isomerase